MRLCAVVTLALLMIGCERPVDKAVQEINLSSYRGMQEMRLDSERRSRKACLKAGGMVVENGWDNLMKECRRP